MKTHPLTNQTLRCPEEYNSHVPLKHHPHTEQVTAKNEGSKKQCPECQVRAACAHCSNRSIYCAHFFILRDSQTVTTIVRLTNVEVCCKGPQAGVSTEKPCARLARRLSIEPRQTSLTASPRKPSSPEEPRNFGAAERQRSLATSPPFPLAFGLSGDAFGRSSAIQSCKNSWSLPVEPQIELASSPCGLSLKLLSGSMQVRQSPEEFPDLFFFLSRIRYARDSPWLRVCFRLQLWVTNVVKMWLRHVAVMRSLLSFFQSHALLA